MNTKKLVLCIGNTRWHWASNHQGVWQYFHTSPDSDKLKTLENPLWVWAAVGEVPQNKILKNSQRLLISDVPFLKLPNWVGIDRALASWAAFEKAKTLDIHNNGILLADAGTIFSLTIISSKGEFIGGQLVAGYQLQLDAMVRGAKNLITPALLNNSQEMFPLTTSEAMHAGTLNALLGVLIEAQKKTKMKIWLCGGDSEIIFEAIHQRNLDIDIVRYPNLVLEGMIDIKNKLSLSTQDP